jgi:hypothetical protein
VPGERLVGTVFVGELGLDGRLRSVPGILPAVACAAAAGFQRAVVPADNASEALLVPAMEVVGAPNLGALVGWARDPVSGGLPGQAVPVVESGAGLAPASAGSTAVVGGLDSQPGGGSDQPGGPLNCSRPCQSVP